MSVGWFATVAAADTYSTDERHIKTEWTDLTTDAQKEAVLTQAYNLIFYDEDYDVPTYANATAAQLEILSRANAEMAYFLLVHLAGMDKRKGLQAQATIESGLVKEKYDADYMQEPAIPAHVKNMLKSFSNLQPAYKGDLERDEDYSVDENILPF